MQITCPKCQKNIQIAKEKLPADKPKAMIKCPGCQQVISFNIPGFQPPVQNLPKEEKTEIGTNTGWSETKSFNPKLTEISTGKTFYLQNGINIPGRKGNPAIDNGDHFMSRKHCVIEVNSQPGSSFAMLYDDGSINENGEPSTNGTFYNGTRLNKYDKIYLADGDLVRLGQTELRYNC